VKHGIYIATAYPADEAARGRLLAAMKLVEDSNWLYLTHNWLAGIDDKRASGMVEEDGDRDMRAREALTDLHAIVRAKFFWLLAPHAGGRGCFWEAGTAFALSWIYRSNPEPIFWSTMTRLDPAWRHKLEINDLTTVASGDYKKTIFTDLFDQRFDDDASAFEWITQQAIAQLGRM
jgi:hypothetical protein